MKTLPPDPGRRKVLVESIPAGISFAAGLAFGGVASGSSMASNESIGEARLKVTDFGALGDGKTPSAEGFQRAIDAAEAVGGGVVEVPAGIFMLERTPLIASRVHLRGTGRASVLRGERPEGHRGAALISNKGQQAQGYEGASDWSISHLAIDSPKTNGIVITHAARVYVGFIYGVEAYHHFIDNVGREVLCENLFLTGRSGTSSFQIDSLSGAQTIWDGERAIAPNYDGTQARDLVLRNSIITAVAGHSGDEPKHFSSIHFHGETSSGFMFSNLILGGADIGIYQDSGTHYEDIQIDNLRSTNPKAAALFNAGKAGQRGLMIRGLIHQPESLKEKFEISLYIYGHDNVVISNCQLKLQEAEVADAAIQIVGCRAVIVSSLQAEAQSGACILIDTQRSQEIEHASSRDVLIEGCQFAGFDAGIVAPMREQQNIVSGFSMFINVARPVLGEFIRVLWPSGSRND